MAKLLLGWILCWSVGARANDDAVTVQLSTVRFTQSIGYSGQPMIENTIFPLDIKAGYAWNNGFYLGGNITTMQDISTTGVDNLSGVAVTVGYHIVGFYADVYYYLWSQLMRGDGYTFLGGSNFGMEIGYNTNVYGNYFVGAGLVYKSFSWSESTSPTGARALLANTWTNEYPVLNFGRSF